MLPAGLAPSNLRLSSRATARYIDGDLYGICSRMREIDPNLYAVELSDGSAHSYAIMESGRDGQEYLVFKVRELDGRVLHKLAELAAKPLHERLRIAEDMQHRLEEERKEAELDDLYERVGAPMWTELERCGFMQRPVSYPKAGVVGGKGSLGRT